MRRAKYSAKHVRLPHASTLGFDVTVAKPGYWIMWTEEGQTHVGRVLGRIDEAERGEGLPDCKGHLAVIALACDLHHAHVRWVDPADVERCQPTPPAALLAWITGEDWPATAREIPRIIAMADYGTCSQTSINFRNDPSRHYNARPEYIAQYVLL